MDPLEQYLQGKSGGSDPLEAYLAGKEEGGPESFLSPEKFKPSPSHRKFNNTGPIEQVRSDLDPKQYPTDLASTTDMAAAPFYSAADRLTLGAVTGGLKGYGGPTADRWSKAIENYRQSPSSNYTDIPGYMAGGPEMVASAVERAIPKVANPLLRAARNALSSGVTSAAIGGTEAASRGEDLPEIAQDALHSGEGGAVVGGAMAAPLTLAGLASRAVVGSKGGQVRQFLESRGVDVGPGSPGRGGPMDTMVTRGTSDSDIGMQESVSARKGLGMLKQKHSEARAPIGAEKARIEESGGGAAQHEVNDVVTKMRDVAERVGTDDRASAQLLGELDRITKAQGQHFNPDTDNYHLSETQINDLKGKLARLGGTGTSADVRLKPLRDAAKMLQDISAQGPYADVNKQFEAEYARHGRARKQIGLPEKSLKTKDTKSEVSTVKNLIGRAGQNTITAGAQRPELEAFRAENPDIAKEFDRPEILRRRADISFSLLPKKHGGLIERTGSGLGGLALAEPILNSLTHGHFSLKHAAAAAALGLPMQNLPAINARLLYAPAQGAMALEEPFFGAVPMLQQAARNRQEQR